MPAALTLHNIDDELYAAVHAYAAEAKTSLGTAFKQLARRALGLPTAEEKARVEAVNALFGRIRLSQRCGNEQTLSAGHERCHRPYRWI